MSELGLGANMDLIFTVQTKIQKPVNEVFDAVHNPKKLSGYFTSGGSDGPLDEGKTVLWKFNDVGDKIVEGKWRSTEGGLQGSYGNCQGWTHMGLCLKAYLEYGINLRKGSF